MESAINVLVSQFKAFAGKDGSSHTLSKEEFQSLVASQLPNLVKMVEMSFVIFVGGKLYIEGLLVPYDYLQNAADPTAIDQLMGSLDENNDGELTFQEFWQLIGKLASKHGGFSQ